MGRKSSQHSLIFHMSEEPTLHFVGSSRFFLPPPGTWGSKVWIHRKVDGESIHGLLCSLHSGAWLIIGDGFFIGGLCNIRVVGMGNLMGSFQTFRLSFGRVMHFEVWNLKVILSIWGCFWMPFAGCFLERDWVDVVLQAAIFRGSVWVKRSNWDHIDNWSKEVEAW